MSSSSQMPVYAILVLLLFFSRINTSGADTMMFLVACFFAYWILAIPSH